MIDLLLPNGSKIDIINIELPIKHKKKLLSRIKSYQNEFKKKKINFLIDYEPIFNQKIKYAFYKFSVNLLSGYTDYLQKINLYNINNSYNSNNKVKNDNDGFYFGDNIRFKINYNSNNINNNETLFIKAIFNIDEFISKFSKDNHIFYKVFCNTKLL